MTIKIKYSQLDLLIALLGVDYNKLSKTGLDEIAHELGVSSKTSKVALNKKIAGYHGINVDILVNSPNYQRLCDEYRECIAKLIAQKIMDKFGLTEIQAWAVIAAGLGLLDKPF